jgi:hypothetical protein
MGRGERVAVEFMFNKLMEWLHQERAYDSLENMREDAEDYIVDELFKAPNTIVCDYGSISSKVFVDYVFEGKSWDAYEIGNEFLLREVDPEDILGVANKTKVSCLNSLFRFSDTLRSSIKVTIIQP